MEKRKVSDFIKLTNNCNISRAFNPTACRVGDKTHILFRCESYTDKELLRGTKAWGNSFCSYWMENYDSSFNSIGYAHTMKFKVGDRIYKDLKRFKTSAKKFVFEEIRIIHNTQFISDTNEDCCYASFNICREYSEQTNDCKVGICLVNFSNGIIEFIDYININSQVIFDKNWGVFLHNKRYYAIYSSFPLVYASSDKLTNIVFGRKLPTFDEMELSISCNPLQVADNEYLIVVHKKKDIFSYNFYIVRFKVVDGQIEYIGSQNKLDIPSEDYFCCSLVRIDDKIILLGGVENKYSVYINLDKGLYE